jgi:hypothetical protein
MTTQVTPTPTPTSTLPSRHEQLYPTLAAAHE